jgi:DNA polymerase III delta prime subunit
MSSLNNIDDRRWYLKYQVNNLNEFFGLKSNRELIAGLAGRNDNQGILITGYYGTGKTSTARFLLKSMSCESHNLKPCEQCDSCVRYNNQSYTPDKYFDGANLQSPQEIEMFLSLMDYRQFSLFIDNIDNCSKTFFIKFLGCFDHCRSRKIIMTATNLSPIPKPLRQRLIIVNLVYEPSDILKLAKKICSLESINIIDEDALANLVELSGNNPRGIINVLEIIQKKGAFIDSNTLSDDDVLGNCFPPESISKRKSSRRKNV